ncbi:MAG: O-methyltransferase [Saprospiraceae bacterium]
MNAVNQIDSVITDLYKDSKNDYFKMMKGIAKSVFRPMQPSDFKDVYLAISQEQGNDLIKLITTNNIKNIVEFGTSFGISTLFLAQGVKATKGKIITTELIPSKAQQAIENFKRAGANDLIEVRVGDALKTLSSHKESIDLLLLDGWKDLYLPIFQLLEPNFHSKTIIYVDNADMAESQAFLNTISGHSKYHLDYKHHGKVVLISVK